VIADKVQGSHGLSCGTVCHRTGVQPMEPKGLAWDYGIGVRVGTVLQLRWGAWRGAAACSAAELARACTHLQEIHLCSSVLFPFLN